MMSQAYNPFRVPRDAFSDIKGIRTFLILGDHPRSIPKVSILIPTYCRPELLREALISALHQKEVEDYEVIVLDNDPTPNLATEAVIRQHLCPRLTYYRNEKNIGMTGNWNRCIELARGEWISFLHDDDYLSPMWLQRMLRHLPPNADMMASHVRVGSQSYSLNSFDQTTDKSLEPGHVDGKRLILGNISPAPGLLIRKVSILNLRGFDDGYYPCADYDLYSRLTVRGKVWIYPEVLSYYRTSDSETYKGNTLVKMISTSVWMKQGLLSLYPSWVAILYYVDSLREWSRVARAHGVEMDMEGVLNGIAIGLGRVQFLGRGFSFLVRLISKLDLLYPSNGNPKQL